MYEWDIAPERVLGWAALYWDGQGSVNQADVYSSIETPWSTVLDPEQLPTTGLQAYLVFVRRNSCLYTAWFDGYDEYWLMGKTAPVAGVLLSDAKWGQMQNRIRQAWQNRSAFLGAYTDWLNEV